MKWTRELGLCLGIVWIVGGLVSGLLNTSSYLLAFVLPIALGCSFVLFARQAEQVLGASIKGFVYGVGFLAAFVLGKSAHSGWLHAEFFFTLAAVFVLNILVFVKIPTARS